MPSSSSWLFRECCAARCNIVSSDECRYGHRFAFNGLRGRAGSVEQIALTQPKEAIRSQANRELVIYEYSLELGL
ncbi:hypothetical protein TMatcc_002647 [Talaromyces marneffei ATCC 18224]